MSGSSFSACDHIFGFGCSGEVVNLVRVAERYGVLMEKARARMEAVCRECRNFGLPSGRREDAQSSCRKIGIRGQNDLK